MITNQDVICKIYRVEDLKPGEIRGNNNIIQDENMKSVREQVSRILEQVRRRGDDALRE